MKTLKIFLEKHDACLDGFEFAKDLTLEQFLETCERGDWILWLFARTNPESLSELTLAKGHCANTVRHLMTDKRSVEAVEVAIAFGEGRATREKLNVVAADAYAAGVGYANAAAWFAAADVADAYAAGVAADAAAWFAAADVAFAADAAADAYSDAEKQNQKQTADICRKFLPIEIWDQSQF
jgi:hypothetical protein